MVGVTDCQTTFMKTKLLEETNLPKFAPGKGVAAYRRHRRADPMADRLKRTSVLTRPRQT